MASRHVGGLCGKHKAWICHTPPHSDRKKEGDKNRVCPPTLCFLRWVWERECVCVCQQVGLVYLYSMFSTVNRAPPVPLCYVYMLHNATLRSVCLLSGFSLVGSVDVLGAERCGGDHGVLCGSTLAFGPDVQRRPADRHGTDALHSSPRDPPPPPHTHTHTAEVNSTWPHDLALWEAEVRRQESKRNRKRSTCLSFSALQFLLLHKPLSYTGYETFASLYFSYAGDHFKNVNVSAGVILELQHNIKVTLIFNSWEK